jgi:hypothetical protein
VTWEPWKTEAALVGDFTAAAVRQGWVGYAETAGWDLLLVRPADGFQIGIEAKLSLNATVLCQTIEHDSAYRAGEGPDCRAILVPGAKAVNGLATIAARLGVVIITGREPSGWGVGATFPQFTPDLPRIPTHGYDFGVNDEFSRYGGWPERCPDRRCKLPDYIPDVTGGHSAPTKLTEWKVLAIKAAVIMELRGYITRADFKALKLDSRRWTDGWLKSNGDGGWVPHAMPDFRAQHPVNYEQIKADFPKWAPMVGLLEAMKA